MESQADVGNSQEFLALASLRSLDGPSTVGDVGSFLMEAVLEMVIVS